MSNPNVKNGRAKPGSICFNVRFHGLKKVLPYSKKVLEVGCGNGMITEELIKRKNKVTALDYSKKVIDCLKKKKLKAKFICQDFLDFSDSKKYDCIICTAVLEHIKDDILALKKMQRLLKNGGQLILSVPICQYKDYYRKTMGHLRHYELVSLKKTLERMGFKVKKEKIWGSFIRYFVIYLLPKKGKKLAREVHPLIEKILTLIALVDVFVCPLRHEVRLVLIKKGKK